ncbi:M23 family metallopeptidase [Desulfosporosinus sp. Sb-LF]|uniref:murein hydrolase activator EnvC family protein n=1 Tax=Desulfosporosinus sp. Sb-LF TaxID=2560027 RepID=UPI00107EFD4D|nr:M23 family metallopeptidase [Desulfosporosinus sp. Sb-LF]TGE32014.1 M23 family metallopeptidase [Desulfosporosinus sp. Sb-LF]
MNPFERWDDWEWERAIHEVGKEQGRGKSAPRFNPQLGRYRNPVKTGWGNWLNHWNGTQKRSLISAIVFLLIFFSANSSDPFSQMIHSVYRSAMDSANYYDSLNGMAKDALSMGGVGSKDVPVDAKMKGQFLPPISGQVVAGFGEKGEGGSNAVGSIHNGIDVESALGIPVIAPASGIVTLVGEDPQLGKIVKLDLGDGWTTVLGNLGGISVQKGQRIEKGNVLGTVGLSAPLKKPWLHFELRKNNQPVNPIPYLVPPKTKN